MASDAEVLPELGNETKAGAMIDQPSDSVLAVDGAKSLFIDDVSGESPAVNMEELSTSINAESAGDTIAEVDQEVTYIGTMEFETESVSDEDLSQDGKHLDTEAISDDELRAESLSENEIPPMKRVRSPLKKKKLLGFKLVDWDEVMKKIQSSTLPDLVKYWNVVRNEPKDFTPWAYLLQYVDQEDDWEAARLAYDTFLSMYPYCYGYWRKYADYEKRQGNTKACEEVFKRGLKAIPLSVDLWLHYLTHCKSTLENDETALRLVFESSIDKCGLEFRSDRIWSMYLLWEAINRRYKNVLKIYDQIFQTPLQNLENHFENFRDFVNTHRPSKMLSVDEFLTIRSYVVNKLKTTNTHNATISEPPGESEDSESNDQETIYMRERIVAIRYKMYKATMAKVADRWNFETSIKRPYFHVKPLEKSQLDNWIKYLDFEISSGDFKRIVVLFERALIACAMYQQYWLKYVKYLEACDVDARIIRNIYKRAYLVHVAGNPNVALAWAWFEESQGNLIVALQIYTNVYARSNDLLLVQLRRIGFERRCGNLDTAAKLFEEYIASSKQKSVTLALISKYAEFCHQSLRDSKKAYEILTAAIAKYPDELKLYYQLLSFVRSTSTDFDRRYVDVVNSVLANDSISLETKLQFAQMKLEYQLDLGVNVRELNEAQEEYLRILRESREMQAERYKTQGMEYYSRRQ